MFWVLQVASNKATKMAKNNEALVTATEIASVELSEWRLRAEQAEAALVVGSDSSSIGRTCRRCIALHSELQLALATTDELASISTTAVRRTGDDDGSSLESAAALRQSVVAASAKLDTLEAVNQQLQTEADQLREQLSEWRLRSERAEAELRQLDRGQSSGSNGQRQRSPARQRGMATVVMGGRGAGPAGDIGHQQGTDSRGAVAGGHGTRHSTANEVLVRRQKKSVAAGFSSAPAMGAVNRVEAAALEEMTAVMAEAIAVHGAELDDGAERVERIRMSSMLGHAQQMKRVGACKHLMMCSPTRMRCLFHDVSEPLTSERTRVSLLCHFL
eukprot:SAG22_NODE_634_length_8373_cov_4.731085_8_plen_331_part_00